MINLTSLNWDRYRKLMVVNCKTTFLFGWHLYSGAMSVPGRLSPAGAVKNTRPHDFPFDASELQELRRKAATAPRRPLFLSPSRAGILLSQG